MERSRQPLDTAEAYEEHTIQHFRWMLYFMTAGFLLTEILAWTGIVPHLRPVSFQEVTANILFAIGFGCPLVLYLSTLPRWRECIGTLVAGLLLALLFWAIQQWLGLPPALKASEVAAAQMIVGLGLASLGTLARRAWSGNECERRAALLYLLPACVALVYTLEAGIFLYFIKDLYPITKDASTYVVDAAYGIQLSFATGRLFAALPLLKLICFAIYVAPPPALVFVYALQTRARRPPPVDVVTVLLFTALTGYAFYFLFPVCGPLFAFGEAFPNTPPPASDLIGKRLTITDKDAWPNGMPSLHLASVLLAYWHARPYGRVARAVAAVFVMGTALATLGLGEHYFVDLVVALPFTLALHAACMPRWESLRRARRDAFLGSATLVAIWYLVLFFGISFLLISPLIIWSLTLGTVAAVLWLERRLYRATLALAPDAGACKIAPGPRGSLPIGNTSRPDSDSLDTGLDALGRHPGLSKGSCEQASQCQDRLSRAASNARPDEMRDDMNRGLKHVASLSFNYLAGITAGDWWRLLSENGFAVNPIYWHRAAFITLMSLVNSYYRRREERLYGERVAATPLVGPPLFVIGHWRSGTSHLHNLLALDTDQFAYANTYQVVSPHTFLCTEEVNTRRFARLLPKSRPMDNMALDFQTPQEDEFAVCLNCFRSLYLGISFPRREDHYDRYLTFRDVPRKEIDEWKAALLWFLKKLTFKYGRTILLKSPPHTARIRLLRELFPDALFVNIHRDPYAVFRSFQHYFDTAVWYTYLQAPNRRQIEERILRRYTVLYDAYFADRDCIPAGHHHELSFAELERDPVGQMRILYEKLNLAGWERYEPKLRIYLGSIAGYQKNKFIALAPRLREAVAREWRRSFDVWGYPM